MLIQCPECHQAISSETKNCPHCGFSIRDYNLRPKTQSQANWRMIWIIIIAVMLWFIIQYLKSK